MPRLRKRMTILLGVLAVLYLGLCVLARVAYPKLLFPAPRLSAPPDALADWTARGAELLRLEQGGGAATPVLYLAPRDPDARVVVMLHGNGETMFDRLPLAEAIVLRGLGVALVEYRGYGLAHGPSPAEAEIYADAARALDALEARGIGRERIALWGTSLGTGPAAEMARRGRAARLVLVTPFTSIVDVAARIAPFLPVRVLLSHRFDTLAKAGEIACPTLVVHGDADEIVPFDMGEAVAARIRGSTFVRVSRGRHNDLFSSERDGAPGARELLERVLVHVGGR
jgi:pimeloyl-ACP methyl ester carboxylesterase